MGDFTHLGVFGQVKFDPFLDFIDQGVAFWSGPICAGGQTVEDIPYTNGRPVRVG